MELQRFDKELFNKVVHSNLDAFVNTVIQKAEWNAITLWKSLATQEEVMNIAVRFFNKQLSEYLTNRL